jgi:hypothetical protein
MVYTLDQARTVAEVRSMIGSTTLSDEDIIQRYEAAAENAYATAAAIWGEKAAEYADLTDVIEGSSRRPLSQLSAQAQKMQDTYLSLARQGSGATSGRTRVREIERP